MAEKKKGQKADFAKDKGAFHEGGSAKGAGTSQRGQQKKSGTHQPRDADRTSISISALKIRITKKPFSAVTALQDLCSTAPLRQDLLERSCSM